jgi:hypothetical protein
MKVGDLVRYVPISKVWDDMWKDYRGLVVRSIPGHDSMKLILWMNGDQQSIPERNLEVVSEGR